MQVPRFLDNPSAHQQRQQHREDRTGSFDEGVQWESFKGALKPLQSLPPGAVEGQQQKQQQRQEQADAVSVTARFVVAYSGPGELRNATLNISPPPGFSAIPSSALLPPVRGTGNGGGGAGGGEKEPLVVEVVLRADRATGRLPSTLVGQASVVYARPGTGGDERSEPMSVRCDLRVPLSVAGRVVQPSTRKGGNTLKFTFNTSRPAVVLSALFEDMAMPTQKAGGGGDSTPAMYHGSLPLEDSKSNGAGGAPAVGFGDGGGGGALMSGIRSESSAFTLRYWAAGPDAEGASQDVSVAVSKNSGRYRVQSESLPALCVVASEVVRRLREYFGEPSAGRDRGSQDGKTADERTAIPSEGENIYALLILMFNPGAQGCQVLVGHPFCTYCCSSAGVRTAIERGKHDVCVIQVPRIVVQSS